MHELAGIPIYFLIAYNLLFFWKIYANPFSLATSELLSTFFPSWVWQGRMWAKGKIPKNDPHYWIVGNAHPVICTYYPLGAIFSYLWSKTSKLDLVFRSFVYFNFLHSLGGSVGSYLLFIRFVDPLTALFGALTLTYASYNIKQQPCLIYTIAWFPWLLLGIAKHSILLSSVSFGMMLLAGYYPIGIQTTLIATGASVLWGCPLIWLPIGTLLGLPQIIPFLKYLPKTIRANAHDDLGKVRLSHLATLVFPGLNKPRDVGFWETSCYVGIVPLIGLFYFFQCFPVSRVWILGVASFILAMGAFSRWLPRIPARWLFTFQFSLGWMVVSALDQLNCNPLQLCGLLFIQAFDLYWHNSPLLPCKPYCELPNRPSFAFNTQLTRFLIKNCQKDRISGLPHPLFTGHLNKFRTLGYSGGMQLKLMARWRNDKNSNGSGEHDYFKSNTDGEAVDRYRIEFAYTRKRLDWPKTSIKYLYRNPRFQGC